MDADADVVEAGTEPIGRREAHKRATRAAIERSARELFAARGFDAVTVREVAERAGVTERTFYRYYMSKHELVADDARAWAAQVRKTIIERPPEERPLEAVWRAISGLSRRIVARPETAPVWVLNRRPRPFEVLGQSDPAALLRFEEAISGALRDRSGARPAAGDEAELVARVCVAVVRTAAIRRRGLELDGHKPDPATLIDEEFTRLLAVTNG